MSGRIHYMTINYMNDVDVTHIVKDGVIEVTFERAVVTGSQTAVFLLDGTILSNSGFNDADISYFKNFVLKHAEVIGMESRGEI